MTQKAEDRQALRGLKILVVDDEFLIAVAIEDSLKEAGAEIISAATSPDAMKIAAEAPLAAAVLDVRLGRQTSEEVADVLATRGIPFVFYSGQPLPENIREKHAAAQLLMKPVNHDALIHAVTKLAGR